MSDLADLRRIAGASYLDYPIETKADFVVQLSRAGTVLFRDREYDATQAAGLIPAFFFPLDSADDLVGRATELLAARGLADGRETAVAQPPPSAHVDAVVSWVEAALAPGSREEDRVHALDVVTHALDFAEHRQALGLWREALWQRCLDPEARTALVAMLVHLQAAVARGDRHAASEICDCLEDLIDPGAATRPRSGGLRRADEAASRTEG